MIGAEDKGVVQLLRSIEQAPPPCPVQTVLALDHETYLHHKRHLTFHTIWMSHPIRRRVSPRRDLVPSVRGRRDCEGVLRLLAPVEGAGPGWDSVPRF